MAVVKNLMIRIGADYSPARKAMQGATNELNRFKNDATRATNRINGKNGIGGISSEFKSLGASVSSSLSRIKGAQGVGGVLSELGSLAPVARTAASGLMGLGVAATSAGAALGPAGLAVAALTAILAVATVGIYQASQTAVKFDSTIGRLNMQLKGGARDFMDWARAQGLAKTEAAEMGATYSVLLSSFTSDNKRLQDETKKLVQATRVVASATGRSIDDTMERMRSGLLGNTEAIEDLGIFVNVAMIESTKAFKQFANGKSWDQLDFRVQQQIRLAAILEQTYARYGDKLQNNVMTKQDNLMAQLKDIKLNLSQAFLPIWDTILPALTQLATAVADTTERIARFVYWLKGWDYEEKTKGTNQQTDAVKDLGNAYEKAGDQAKNALAPFDEINQLGDLGGGGSSGNSGSGGTGGSGSSGGTGSGGGIKLPDLPTFPRMQLQFDPPSPPDAGAGAVATAVVSTINEMTSAVKQDSADMWNQLGEQAAAGRSALEPEWHALQAVIDQTSIPLTNAQFKWLETLDFFQTQLNAYRPYLELGWKSLQLNIQNTEFTLANLGVKWDESLNYLQTQLNAYRPYLEFGWQSLQLNIQNTEQTLSSVTLKWDQTLNYFQTQLNAYRPYLEFGWQSLQAKIQETEVPLSNVQLKWDETLKYLQTQLDAYRPYLEYGWGLIGLATIGIIPSLQNTEQAWSEAFKSMLRAAVEKTQPILDRINAIQQAWASMMAMVGTPIQIPDIQLPKIQFPDVSGLLNSLSPDPISGVDPSRNLPILGQILRGLDATGQSVENSGVGDFLRSIFIPGAPVSGVGSAAKGAESQAGAWLEKLREYLNGIGAVPQFAKGGIVNSPTLAMIGEAGKEAVVPLEDTSFVDTLASAIGSAVLAAQQVSQGGQSSGLGDLTIQIDGTTLARVLNPYLGREQQRIGNTAIIQPV